jgi:hypothetical protein
MLHRTIVHIARIFLRSTDVSSCLIGDSREMILHMQVHVGVWCAVAAYATESFEGCSRESA